MNLIQQLQATPKWKEFKEWYYPYYMGWSIPMKETKTTTGFTFLHPDFQKGVFEKFIESRGQKYYKGQYSDSHYLTYPKSACEEFNSFEELLIWYFNN